MEKEYCDFYAGTSYALLTVNECIKGTSRGMNVSSIDKNEETDNKERFEKIVDS